MFCSPNKLDYQWSFSYLTGFTGSIGFSFLFLSFLNYWIFFSFSQFPEETEKEESRYAGEMKLGCAFSMECHNTISGLTPEPSLAAFGGIGFLSTKIVSILFILSNTLRKIN